LGARGGASDLPDLAGTLSHHRQYSVERGDHSRDPTLEEIQAIVEQRGPKGVSLFDPIWLSSFRINSRKVASYRSGRAFLSGDAVHIHSPAGGEGMNTGMQDAFNLAWKLALAIHGTSGEALLDTYSPERSGVGDEILKNTSRLTAVGTLNNPVAEELRNIVGRFALGLAPVQHALVHNMSQVSVGYPQSPMNGRAHSSFPPRPANVRRRSPARRPSAQVMSRASLCWLRLRPPSPACCRHFPSF
jgi:2-polyprenyl-6-methoxyphenol hydroxylase-like FAD-dependent oxidoreductase